MKLTLCTVSGCPFYGRYCRNHLSGSVEPPKPIEARSKKLAATMRKVYVPEVKEMVEANTPCAIKSKDCTGIAQGFHHLHGRTGEQLLKDKLPCCNACNVMIEKNDAFARQQGWKKSKFSIPAKNQKIGEI